MSDFATFTLSGTVVQEPEVLSSFSNGQKFDAVKFTVQVRRPAQDGKQDMSEEMEISAWYATKAQVEGLRRGQAVLVHGNVSARRGQRGGTFYSLRATAVRALNGFGQQQEQRERMRDYQQQSNCSNNSRGCTQQTGKGYMGQRAEDMPPTVEDDDIPF